jgi:hypothetical protein
VELLAAVWGARTARTRTARLEALAALRAGRPARRGPGEQAVIARLIHLRDDGRTWKQVAEALGDVLDLSGVKKVCRWETAMGRWRRGRIGDCRCHGLRYGRLARGPVPAATEARSG